MNHLLLSSLFVLTLIVSNFVQAFGDGWGRLRGSDGFPIGYSQSTDPLSKTEQAYKTYVECMQKCKSHKSKITKGLYKEQQKQCLVIFARMVIESQKN